MKDRYKLLKEENLKTERWKCYICYNWVLYICACYGICAYGNGFNGKFFTYVTFTLGGVSR